jgi:hypothetical protein
LGVTGDDDVPTVGVQVLSSMIGGVTVTMNSHDDGPPVSIRGDAGRAV